MNFHFIDKETAINMINGLNILHVYGDLGSYEQCFNIDSPKDVANAIQRIRVIGDERLKSTDDLREEIFLRIDVLKRLYFLGFGFDVNNTKLVLGKYLSIIENRRKTVPQLSRSHPPRQYPELVSTNIGLTPQHSAKVLQLLEGLSIDWGREPRDCSKLINADYPLDKKFSDRLLF
jgi:hypothetical protein